MGVSGKDMLLEEGGAELYEPLDLNIAKCRLMTAGLPEKSLPMGRVRVATKFVNVAKDFYARQGVQVDVIKLYGAMELAPIMGLCDRIVDIVDTGNTLRANGLVPMEHIADVSTRLVVNKASLKMKHQKIDELIKQLSMAVDARK
jgi:ATP phosphoribosyltransferase